MVLVAVFECKMWHAPVSQETWSKYGKRCKDCYDKHRERSQIDRSMGFHSLLYVFCITYGHVFLGSYLAGITHPGSAISAVIIASEIGAIICYAIAVIALIFFARAVHKLKLERPNTYAAQRWYPIFVHSAVVVVSVVALFVYGTALLR